MLTQLLMASTYPLEVVQADRWAKQNKDVKGDALAKALESQSWDPSVKSLVNFPQVLTMMSENLDTTVKIGDAMIGQQKEVMATIQKLRAKAQENGNLKTTSEQTVVVEQQAANPVIVIQPANPQVVYIPTYSPTVYYATWPYPAYPPAPYYPPGYVAGRAVAFGAGVALGAAWGHAWGHSDWHGGSVDIDVNRNANFNSNINRSIIVPEPPGIVPARCLAPTGRCLPRPEDCQPVWPQHAGRYREGTRLVSRPRWRAEPVGLAEPAVPVESGPAVPAESGGAGGIGGAGKPGGAGGAGGIRRRGRCWRNQAGWRRWRWRRLWQLWRSRCSANALPPKPATAPLTA